MWKRRVAGNLYQGTQRRGTNGGIPAVTQGVDLGRKAAILVQNAAKAPKAKISNLILPSVRMDRPSLGLLAGSECCRAPDTHGCIPYISGLQGQLLEQVVFYTPGRPKFRAGPGESWCGFYPLDAFKVEIFGR